MKQTLYLTNYVFATCRNLNKDSETFFLSLMKISSHEFQVQKLCILHSDLRCQFQYECGKLQQK